MALSAGQSVLVFVVGADVYAVDCLSELPYHFQADAFIGTGYQGTAMTGLFVMVSGSVVSGFGMGGHCLQADDVQNGEFVGVG